MTSPVVVETSQSLEPVDRDTFISLTPADRERMAAWPWPRRRPRDA